VTPVDAPAANDVVLSVRDLVTTFDTDVGRLTAVDGVSFDVRRGRTLGIVGESGCGKSVTALSIMRLLPQPMGRIQGGRILFEGRDLATLPPAELHRIRGGRIGMIFQEPMTALNPVQPIGRQLSEVFLLHRTRDTADAWRRGTEMLRKVGIPAPETRMHEYPHQLSGGMRQRVVIAMALACEPAVVIADEPTTALDVSIQGQILHEMRRLARETGVALVWITHDLAVVSNLADDIAVMYAGRIVERGTAADVLQRPRHPYTRGLLDSVPGDAPPGAMLAQIPGTTPSLLALPPGCSFRERCARADMRCTVMPALTPRTGSGDLRCHNPLGDAA